MDSTLASDRVALIDLSGPGHYLTWGIIQISAANLIVILLMIAVFVVALLAPFPGRSHRVPRDGDGRQGGQRS